MARHFGTLGSSRTFCARFAVVALSLASHCLLFHGQLAAAEPAVIQPAQKPAEDQPAEIKPATIVWHKAVDAAWKISQKDRRPMLVFFTAADCQYCTLMERETFHNQRVAGAVSDGYVPVTVTAAQAPKLAEQLKLRAYPTTVIISPDKHVLDTITGYVSAETLSERLADISKKIEVAKR